MLLSSLATGDDEPSSIAAGDGGGDGNIDVKHPLVGERAWFENHESSFTPIYIGEAACSAFVARLRQFLTSENTASHITRVKYTKDSKLLATGKEEIKWPDLAQAQLLVKAALNHIGTVYHIMLKKSSLDELEGIYRTARFDDLVSTAKYFALFALDEVYSARTSQSHSAPGMHYFARALGMVHILPEQPSIEYIETLLLLALFSFLLDRRHSRYILISNAVEHSVAIGLNHNIPESQLVDQCDIVSASGGPPTF
ncbi:hypothetical protein AJ80_02308 [Polytolypa hystricis UAMH7299]|uniref:Transcription factor domain-containing protein n=1 Tax=Polytolypa hystricis (strain UAMH7299) TaxID=1447883 RepID=A0A2B7YS61_POLH7|nr:hypothetical protein AJ80_02308 [Polytolypa hystricis UAMH7299]